MGSVDKAGQILRALQSDYHLLAMIKKFYSIKKEIDYAKENIIINTMTLQQNSIFPVLLEINVKLNNVY